MSQTQAPKREIGDHAVIGGTVWILHVSHRHGDDIMVHHSEQGAREAIVAYVDANWDDEIVGRVSHDGPTNRPEDDKEAVALYFKLVDDEWYEIDRTPLLP